jgi:AraC-like DNA-binding protein
VSVADAARRAGFTRTSRFSAAYRERYGCEPRHSLQALLLLAGQRNEAGTEASTAGGD